MSQLPPQSPDDYPYLSAGQPTAGPGAGCAHPGAPAQPPAAGVGGYPWGAPEPFPHPQAVPYPQVMMLPPPVPSWSSPELVMRRKRATNRRVAIVGGVLGLITSVAQLAYLVIVLLNGTYFELEVGLAIFIVFVGPLGVGVGWVSSFIPALVACLQARSRGPRTQPDGWPEAKGVTSVLLALSIALGVPVASLVGAVYLSEGRNLGTGSWGLVFGGSTLGAGIIAVAYIILLIKICTLDVTARPGAVASPGGAC